MPEFAFVELPEGFDRFLWREFVTDFDRDLDRWEYSHYPNGDYLIFVAKDLSFGVAGDPHEQSLCFFGAPAVTAAENHNHGVLTHALRRNGIPVLEPPPWRQTSTRAQIYDRDWRNGDRGNFADLDGTGNVQSGHSVPPRPRTTHAVGRVYVPWRAERFPAPRRRRPASGSQDAAGTFGRCLQVDQVCEDGVVDARVATDQ